MYDEFFKIEESEQYAFYRVPKLLFSNKRFWNLSADAKLLYGLLLDRMALSQKNGWVDKEGRVYGRMIEIYLLVSLAPIPFSTFANREQSSVGQNYLRALFAIGFQGFLIMICVGIYAVLVQSVAFSDDIIASIWGVMGYTVLLCFSLFKTSTLAKTVFSAH